MQGLAETAGDGFANSSGTEHDMAFAVRAALYLERQGLEHSAVVQCLIDEFDLDREAARTLVLMGT